MVRGEGTNSCPVFRLSVQETIEEEGGPGGGCRHHVHCIFLSEKGPSKGMRMGQAQCEDGGGREGRHSWARLNEKRRGKRENTGEGGN